MVADQLLGTFLEERLTEVRSGRGGALSRRDDERCQSQVHGAARGSYENLEQRLEEINRIFLPAARGLVRASSRVPGVNVVLHGVWIPFLRHLHSAFPDLSAAALGNNFHQVSQMGEQREEKEFELTLFRVYPQAYTAVSLFFRSFVEIVKKLCETRATRKDYLFSITAISATYLSLEFLHEVSTHKETQRFTSQWASGVPVFYEVRKVVFVPPPLVMNLPLQLAPYNSISLLLSFMMFLPVSPLPLPLPLRFSFPLPLPFSAAHEKHDTKGKL